MTGLYFRDGILIRHLWFRELLGRWAHPVGQRQGKGLGHITAPGDPVGAADPGVPEASTNLPSLRCLGCPRGPSEPPVASPLPFKEGTV